MRFFEAASDIGVEKKDLKILLDLVNQAGHGVKNSLAVIDPPVEDWMKSHADELLSGLASAKTAKKPAPPRKAPPKKTAKKTATKAKPATKKSAAGTAESKPAAPATPGTGTGKPLETTPAATAKTGTARPLPPKKEKPKKVPRPKVAAPKRVEGKDLRLPRSAKDAPQEAELVLDETQAPEEKKHTGHKHKRADFRGQLGKPDLPSVFASLDADYTRSIGGAAGRRRPPRRSGGNRGPRRGRSRQRTQTVTRERDPNQVAELSLSMTVRDVSVALGVKLNEIMGYLMRSGHMVQVNDILDEELMTLVAEEFQIPYQWKSEQNLEQQIEAQLEGIKASTREEDLMWRPPVITFMGHVDHGKTSLLDKIRQTRVAAGEAGGITQHIGAYTVEKNGQPITFLDTPGHEAFTAMRARGANLTDIAVLVVAADDGVMPQTKEALSHARSAGVPVVVAINKCDLPSANPDRVRQGLSTQLELLPEEWGGQTGMVEVSAHTGDGIDELLERILLEAEVLELKADPTRHATGYVIESRMTENRGVVATVLVHDGTLRRGDVLLTGNGYGKVKLMYDHTGATTEEAGPSMAVSVTGLNNVPDVGDSFYVIDDLLKARAVAESREKEAHAKALSKARRRHVTLENLTSYLQQEQRRELNLIVKADVSGSIEVLEKTLTDLSTEEVQIRIIHAGVGGVTQADIILADASDALVVGFHVIADQTARLLAQSHGVQIKVYHIIYRLIEDMKAALEGMLPPEEKETVEGHVEIREIFRSSRLGNIAGCFVTDGIVTRHSRVRLIRDNIVIYDGTIDSLRRVKDDAREVRAGFECGIRVAGYSDIREGDILEAYKVEEVARKLGG